MKFVRRMMMSALLGAVAPALAATAPDDPLDSTQWPTMHRLFLNGEPAVFDERVKVVAPVAAEDSLQVPVMVDASALPDVQRIVVVADFNPLPKVLEFEPGKAAARLGFRLKLQQASPIRAAALTSDGVWHVGGQWVDAAGGGCTLPSVASADPIWATRLGEVSGGLFAQTEQRQRLRFSVVHPMDTGLADGIPVFIVETVDLFGPQGEKLASIRPLEPVSENPIFSLDLPAREQYSLDGRDNNGNRFRAALSQ